MSASGTLFRQMRIWHGYLSALAFAALIFFAATGLMLNHPGWLMVKAQKPAQLTFTLTAAEIADVKAAKNPSDVLVGLVARRIRLIGAQKDADVSGEDVFIRLQGVRGSSDVRANLATGQVQAVVEAAHPVAIIDDLHRASSAGGAWRLTVDIIAVAMLVVSILGLVIFFSLRLRLKSSLLLIAIGAAAVTAVFVFTVP